MCEVAERLENRGRKEGRAEGRAEGRKEGRAEGERLLILKMYHNGFTAEQIAAATDKKPEEVKAILTGKARAHE